MAPPGEDSTDDPLASTAGDLGSGAALGLVVASFAVGLGVAWAIGQGAASVAGMPVAVWCAVLAFGVQWVVFVPSLAARTDHYYDLTGTVTYLGVVLLGVFFGGVLGEASEVAGPRLVRTAVAAGLTAVWSLRLGIFLFRRVKRAGKDGRFDEIKHSGPRFLVAWTLQGLWVILTLAAVLVVLTVADAPPLGLPFYAGVAIWIAGFAIEAIADGQKSAFKKDPANQGRFITSGLWSWSRHPNYFGEIVLWIGMTVLALPLLEGWRWLALLSPVFVIILLVKGSGVPLLEARADERWGGEEAYERYKARTSVLIPLPPRSAP